jgi:hypothetical protein
MPKTLPLSATPLSLLNDKTIRLLSTGLAADARQLKSSQLHPWSRIKAHSCAELGYNF